MPKLVPKLVPKLAICSFTVPKKESDLNEAKKITSRRVDHNARRALHGGQLNGEMPCEKEWDNLPASYMKKGYDSRTPKEKIYIPPSKKDAGTRKMERTMESGRIRPSSFAFQRGKVEYRKTTNDYANRQSIPLASENETISNLFQSIFFPGRAALDF